MKTRKLVGRLAVAAVLVGMLVLLTASPAFPAGPDGGTVAVQDASVWAGHTNLNASCKANVPVNVSALTTGMGGYEMKLGWAAGRFTSIDGDISIDIGAYLTNGGMRQQMGDSSTPPLKAVTTDAVKFGAYSWGANNPPGNQANGQLSVVSLKPASPATCGSVATTLSETQLVDINGNVITPVTQTGNASGVKINSKYDMNGSLTITSIDVLQVVQKLGQDASVACGPNYRYDINDSGTITSIDVLRVVQKLGQDPLAFCNN